MSETLRKLAWFRRLGPGARPTVRTMARALSRRDDDLAQDLEQEGMIAIWQLEPATLRSAKNPERVAIGRAWRAMRRYRQRQRYKVAAPEGEVRSWWERRQRRWVP